MPVNLMPPINRAFREFRRYTGDGLPGAPVSAPLPVGDPSSGMHSPAKSEIRGAFTEFESAFNVGIGQAEAQAAAALADRILAQNAAAAASSSVNPMSFTSVAGVQGATIPALTTYIRTAGYYAPGDKGGALYKKVGSEPSHAGKIQSFDGAWWEISEGVTDPRMFGARIDDTTNDRPALAAWAAYGGVGHFPSGNYRIGSGIDLTNFGVLFLEMPVLKPTFDAGIACILGFSAPGTFIESRKHIGGFIRVLWPTKEWPKDRTSFYAQNCYQCEWGVSSYQGACGVQLNGAGNGSAGMGCVHNLLRLGQMWNNQLGVTLTSSDAFGWCNGNRIVGGFFFGTGTALEQAAGRYASRAGHIFVEDTPYPNNGNHFERQSLEWIGPDFRLARIGGYRNTIEPSYTELDNGTVWFHIFGLENTLYWDTGSTGVFNPAAPDRISIIGAVNPKILAGNNYRRSETGVADYTINNSTGPVHVFENRGLGGGIDVQLDNAAARGIRSLNSAGGVLRAISGTGPDVENGGVNQVYWSATLPSGGVQGDLVWNSQPSVLGSPGSRFTILGWRCVATGTWVEMRVPTGT